MLLLEEERRANVSIYLILVEIRTPLKSIQNLIINTLYMYKQDEIIPMFDNIFVQFGGLVV